MEPERGETAFEIKKDATTTRPSKKRRVISALLLLLLVVFAVWMGSLPKSEPEPGAVPDAGPAASSAPVKPTEPRAQYARFTVADPADSDGATITFRNEQLEVRRVSSIDEVPDDVRDRAVVLGTEKGNVAAIPGTTPYILVGTTAVTVGALRKHDRFSASIVAGNGNVDSIHTSVNLADATSLAPPSSDATQAPAPSDVPVTQPVPTERARPPPGEPRVVYIVGDISAVKGPNLADLATASVHVLDLRVTEQQRARYRQELEEYHEAVRQRKAAHPEQEEEEPGAARPRRNRNEHPEEPEVPHPAPRPAPRAVSHH